MSWLFGYGRKNEQGPDLSQFGIQPPQPPASGAGGSGGDNPDDSKLTKSERKAMEAYRFDSSALERAAQAARELEKSSKFKTLFWGYVLCNNLCIA